MGVREGPLASCVTCHPYPQARPPRHWSVSSPEASGHGVPRSRVTKSELLVTGRPYCPEPWLQRAHGHRPKPLDQDAGTKSPHAAATPEGLWGSSVLGVTGSHKADKGLGWQEGQPVWSQELALQDRSGQTGSLSWTPRVGLEVGVGLGAGQMGPRASPGLSTQRVPPEPGAPYPQGSPFRVTFRAMGALTVLCGGPITLRAPHPTAMWDASPQSLVGPSPQSHGRPLTPEPCETLTPEPCETFTPEPCKTLTPEPCGLCSQNGHNPLSRVTPAPHPGVHVSLPSATLQGDPRGALGRGPWGGP